jgi:serine/threonine-protein kinase RsbT
VTITSITRREMRIETEDDVILVRRAVRAMAEAQRFDSFASAALTTATSELTRNVWVHAGKGRAVLEDVGNGDRRGVRVTFSDEGPGIADIPRVMAGGYSTARSMGMGLSGSKRLVDEFTLDSTVGKGTTVEIVKWKTG